VHLMILIYLLTAIGLTPGGSSTGHIYTKTIHRTIRKPTDLNTYGPSSDTKIHPFLKNLRTDSESRIENVSYKDMLPISIFLCQLSQAF